MLLRLHTVAGILQNDSDTVCFEQAQKTVMQLAVYLVCLLLLISAGYDTCDMTSLASFPMTI